MAGACLVAALVAASAARLGAGDGHGVAASRRRRICRTSSTTRTSPNTFAISGTSNGTTGDHVDLSCYDGRRELTSPSNVALSANGSFSVARGALCSANTFSGLQSACRSGGDDAEHLRRSPGLGSSSATRQHLQRERRPEQRQALRLLPVLPAARRRQRLLLARRLRHRRRLPPRPERRTRSHDVVLQRNLVRHRSEPSDAVRGPESMARTPIRRTGASDINDQATPASRRFKYSYSVRRAHGRRNDPRDESAREVPEGDVSADDCELRDVRLDRVADTRTITQNHDGRVVVDHRRRSRAPTATSHTVDFLWDNEQRLPGQRAPATRPRPSTSSRARAATRCTC